jgi:hypothetical protein
VRFVADSLLEEAGFEPSVPRDTIWVSREAHVTSARFHPDRKFGDQKPVGRDPASATACRSTRRSDRSRSAKPGSYARAESRQNLQQSVVREVNINALGPKPHEPPRNVSMGFPSTAASAKRASAPCRISALDQRLCRFTRCKLSRGPAWRPALWPAPRTCNCRVWSCHTNGHRGSDRLCWWY